jgi:hypothetical protein
MELIWSSWGKLNVPNDLSLFGMGSQHIYRFIADTMDLKAALEQNPVPFLGMKIKEQQKMGKVISH